MAEELDDRIEPEAADTCASKAALIRRDVAATLDDSTPADTVDALVGSFQGAAAGDIDEVVYG